MLLYFSILNQISPKLFFVLNKFTAVRFIKRFNKKNPQWYFISAFWKKKIHSFSFIYINSQPIFHQEFQQNKSLVVLYFSIFNEVNPQLFFVFNQITDEAFIKFFNKIYTQWYFISVFPKKWICSSSLFSINSKI